MASGEHLEFFMQAKKSHRAKGSAKIASHLRPPFFMRAQIFASGEPLHFLACSFKQVELTWQAVETVYQAPPHAAARNVSNGP
jgi:hypothetical protein